MQDAYGRELYDYWRGNHSIKEIVERDDGFIDTSIFGPKLYFMEYKNWPTHQKKAMRFARGRILDIGCGAGRCLTHFQKKGFDIVGIDNSPLTVKVCKERGAKKVLVKSITQLGPDLGVFDTITMLGNNFGLFGGIKRARTLLNKMYKITSDRARIIAETAHPYQTDLPEHLEYHRFNRRRKRLGGQLRIRVRYKKYATEWFDYLLVTPEELEKIIDNTGWGVKKLVWSKGPAYCMVLEKENV